MNFTSRMPGRILIIYTKNTGELGNRQSALGSYIACLCDIFQRSGMHVFVNGIAYDIIKQLPVTANQPGSTSHITKYIPGFAKQLVKDSLVIKKIKESYNTIIGSGTYDCILEFYSYASDVGYRVSKHQKIPLLVVYDAPVLEEYIFFHGKKVVFRKEILKRELNTLKQADAIVAYSNPVKNYLNKLAGKSLPVFIHQNVDFTRFDFVETKPAGDLINIGFVGSFLKWHKVDWLLNAFTRLKQEGCSVQLYLIGMGAEFNSIAEKVSLNKYKELIHIPGFVDGEALLNLKKQIHIGVMPGSNWYGAPNKIFEYGASRMAVVAPKTPTIADLFEDREELILFEESSEQSLYSALKKLSEDKVLMNKLATCLQQKIRTMHSSENTFEFYNGLIKKSLNK